MIFTVSLQEKVPQNSFFCQQIQNVANVEKRIKTLSFIIKRMKKIQLLWALENLTDISVDLKRQVADDVKSNHGK